MAPPQRLITCRDADLASLQVIVTTRTGLHRTAAHPPRSSERAPLQGPDASLRVVGAAGSFGYTKALMPVMERPTMSVFICRVPS